MITLDAGLESSILQGLRDPATGQPLVDPDVAAMIANEVTILAAQNTSPAVPALIVQPPARRALAHMLRQRAPECHVLSISELPASQPIEVIAVIGASGNAGADTALPPPFEEAIAA